MRCGSWALAAGLDQARELGDAADQRNFRLIGQPT